MFNSKAFLVLMIVAAMAAPLVAAIPNDVKLGLVGAKELDPAHYAVRAGDEVLLYAASNIGDFLWVYAAPILKDGSVDESMAVTLLVEADSDSGIVSGGFTIPKGLEGMSFLVRAAAASADGKTYAKMRIDVLDG